MLLKKTALLFTSRIGRYQAPMGLNGMPFCYMQCSQLLIKVTELDNCILLAKLEMRTTQYKSSVFKIFLV